MKLTKEQIEKAPAYTLIGLAVLCVVQAIGWKHFGIWLFRLFVFAAACVILALVIIKFCPSVEFPGR